MKNLMALDVEIRNECNKEFEVVSEIPEETILQPRPKMHFAAKTGWLNDPNGLIYYEGQYHMFFQYNPVGIRWANMHWGHAVSRDLVTWEEKEIALYPDEMGYMYSGSAIEDIHNVTGFKENEHNPLLLFYTAAGGCSALSEGQPYTQCLAYSTDGGENFKKYEGNPIIRNLVDDNRDPTRIVYDEDNKKYIMTFWVTEDEYVFFKSENLIDWEEISRIHMPGELECPDLYPLYDNGVKKWVFAPAFGTYMIGSLDSVNGFIAESDIKKINYGAAQAPQRFSGLDKIIRISWNKCIYDGLLKTYNSIMGTPCEMYLKDGILRIHPIDEFKSRFIEDKTYSKVYTEGFCVPLEAAPSYITLKLQEEKKVEINIFGNSIKIYEDYIETYYLFENKKIISPYEKNSEITIITDDVGIELFVSDKYYLAIQAVCDYSKSNMIFSGTGIMEYLRICNFTE